jgi:biopolymer transport protein ExbD
VLRYGEVVEVMNTQRAVEYAKVALVALETKDGT